MWLGAQGGILVFSYGIEFDEETFMMIKCPRISLNIFTCKWTIRQLAPFIYFQAKGFN